MFKLSMPYDNDHPLFRLEIRHIRWGKSPRHLRRYSFWTIMLVGLIIVILRLATIPEWQRSSAYMFLDDCLGFIGLLGIVSIGANLIQDMACLGFTLNSMDVHKRKTWWELLRLTPSGVQNVIPARHALAQIRSWRVMIIVVGMRITAAMFLLLYIVANWIISPMIMNFDGIVFIGAIVVFVVTYILESVWRMRAMTALGLWISAQVRNVALAGLAGFGVIIGVWISQVIIMGFLLWITVSAMLGGLFEILVMCILIALVIYYYYYFLSETSLKQALRNASGE